MTDPQTTPHDVPSNEPTGSLYRKIVVPLVRAATVLVVVVFLFGGIVTGVAVIQDMYREEPELEANGVTYSCYRESVARPGDEICRYPTAAGYFIGGLGGGAVGLAAGLIASFSIEVGVTVYLAARKYLQSET